MDTTLAEVLSQMSKNAKRQLINAKKNVKLDQKLDKASVSKYLTAVVQLVMLLAEEVVNFKTESMKKMDDIIDKSEKYLADTCDHLDEDNDCIEQFEKTREQLTQMDKSLKEEFQNVLKEKLTIYKDLKTLQTGIQNEVVKVFTEHVALAAQNDIKYKDDIKNELKKFFDSFKLQRQHVQTQLLDPLIKAESSTQKTQQLLEKLETHIGQVKDAVETLQKASQTFKADIDDTYKKVQTQYGQSSKIAQQLKEANDQQQQQLAKVADILVDSSTQVQKMASSVDSAFEKTEQINQIKKNLDQTNTQLAEKVILIQDANANLSLQAAKVEGISEIGKNLEKTSKELAEKLDQIDLSKQQIKQNIEKINSIGDVSQELNERNQKLQLKIDEITDKAVTLVQNQEQQIENQVKQMTELSQEIQKINQGSQKIEETANKLSKGATNMENSVISGVESQKELLDKLKLLYDTVQQNIVAFDEKNDRLTLQQTYSSSKQEQLHAEQLKSLRELFSLQKIDMEKRIQDFKNSIQQQSVSINQSDKQNLSLTLQGFNTELEQKTQKYLKSIGEIQKVYDVSKNTIEQMDSVYQKFTNLNINQQSLEHQLSQIVAQQIATTYQNVNQDALLFYNQSIQQLKDSIENYNNLNGALEQQSQAAQNKLNVILEKIKHANIEIQGKRDEKVRLEQQKSQLQFLNNQIDISQKQRKQLQQDIKKIDSDMQQLRLEYNSLSEEFSQSKIKLIKEYAQLNEESIDMRKKIMKQQSDLDMITQNIFLKTTHDQQLQLSNDEKEQKKSDLNVKISSLINQKEQITLEMKTLQQQLEDKNLKLVSQSNKVESLEKKSMDLETKIFEQRQRIQDYNKRIAQSATDLSEIKSSIKNSLSLQAKVQESVNQSQISNVTKRAFESVNESQSSNITKRTSKAVEKELELKKKTLPDNPASLSFQESKIEQQNVPLFQKRSLNQQTQAKERNSKMLNDVDVQGMGRQTSDDIQGSQTLDDITDTILSVVQDLQQKPDKKNKDLLLYGGGVVAVGVSAAVIYKFRKKLRSLIDL